MIVPTAMRAIVDAVVPQPVPGSRWVPIRRLVSLIGGALGWTANRVPVGSSEVLAVWARRQPDKEL